MYCYNVIQFLNLLLINLLTISTICRKYENSNLHGPFDNGGDANVVVTLCVVTHLMLNNIKDHHMQSYRNILSINIDPMWISNNDLSSDNSLNVLNISIVTRTDNNIVKDWKLQKVEQFPRHDESYFMIVKHDFILKIKFFF
ncbi:hypothetical protein RFI_37414 [Reticulomyxa filosa]|uniref:Uncharacterized protein n=1 Tax=Reticulomyxa filosa TaxID=46433 RepID=X6LH33_RETFI|nr:hypothetical protein RFI_37414 [Reticulomyxa filosa]|eukprot:ETO00045.1 hypothetical protein RFI_37414 [Reticulomyxa filosa]